MRRCRWEKEKKNISKDSIPHLATLSLDEARILSRSLNSKIDDESLDYDKYIFEIPLISSNVLFDVNDLISTSLLSSQQIFSYVLSNMLTSGNTNE